MCPGPRRKCSMILQGWDRPAGRLLNSQPIDHASRERCTRDTPRPAAVCCARPGPNTAKNVKNCHVREDDVNGNFSFPPPVLTGCSELTESSNPTVGMGTGAVCRLRTPRFAEPVGSVHAAPVLGQESALNVENNTERPGRYPAPESPLC